MIPCSTLSERRGVSLKARGEIMNERCSRKVRLNRDLSPGARQNGIQCRAEMPALQSIGNRGEFTVANLLAIAVQ